MRIKKIIKKILSPSLLNKYHLFLSFWGAFICGFPSKKLVVAGVTGTKGKSTTAEFIGEVLEQTGEKTAIISSIRFKIGDKTKINALKMTMPGRTKLQRLLREAVKEGCKYAVVEVTSEGILQSRHKFIDFDYAVFTNISPEHIERHGGFENYKKAKGKLFESCGGTHIINLDDGNHRYFLDFPAKKKITYSIKNPKADIFPRDISILSEKSLFKIGNTQFIINIPGDFNALNAFAALAIAREEGVDIEKAAKGLSNIKKIPGRVERVIISPFRVFVDYAHTPESLEAVYGAVKMGMSAFPEANLICLLGACGGGRDRWKRPLLGKMAARFCDKIYLSNEDPYDEDPVRVVEDVKRGVEKENPNIPILVEMDREKAIFEMLKSAKEGDSLILTGKGCESWICVENGKKIPWDERKVVLDSYKKLGYGK